MEDEKKVDETISEEDLSEMAGASGSSGGYCPYTSDRRCRMGSNYNANDERCSECGWRAW